LSKKNERTLASALGGGEPLRLLKKAMKRIQKPSEDRIGQILERITSIQACKDAALTGDRDLRLLAVMRLPTFGVEALESLELALNDESPLVRTTAAGMLAALGDKDGLPFLEQHVSDNNEAVREAVEYSIGWLQKKGRVLEKPTPLSAKSDPLDVLLEDLVPLATTDDVLVINDYAALPGSLQFGMTLENQSFASVRDVRVEILAYPREALKPVDALVQEIDHIPQGDSSSLIFEFAVEGDCVEGEIITSVTLVDETGEKLAAKSGNVFVRSLYEQVVPVDTTEDDFLRTKSRMKNWNREHMLANEAVAVFEALVKIVEEKNLRIFQFDSSEKKKAFMGIVSAMGKSRLSENRIAVMFTIAGNKKDNLSKLRMDIYADNPEILHSAASALFEEIQKELGVLDE
jgi:hypothetical protein